MSHTGKCIRGAPAEHNEAQTSFKKDGISWMITSGCTGWDPNAARLFKSKNILGKWEELPNPCQGPLAEITFKGQSTYVLPVEGKKDAFIFMADIWRPRLPIESRYLWLPIQFENGLPKINWLEEWDLSVFDK